jgi:hypothetical protein
MSLLFFILSAALSGTSAFLFWQGFRYSHRLIWLFGIAGLIPLVLACLFIASLSGSGGLGGAVGFIIGLFLTVSAFVGAILLLVKLPGKRKLVAAILFPLFPVVLYLSLQAGSEFSPEAKIKSDGEIVAQALNGYRAMNGRYPVKLQDLVPQYLTDLKEPETVWGWLYKASENEFSLGYVWDVDRMGYSVCVYPSTGSKWNCLTYSSGPFDIPATPGPTSYSTPAL